MRATSCSRTQISELAMHCTKVGQKKVVAEGGALAGTQYHNCRQQKLRRSTSWLSASPVCRQCGGLLLCEPDYACCMYVVYVSGV
jgi:hypothetical protein